MNFKNVSTATWTRIIALLLSLINLIGVSIFNVQLLPFDDAQVYEGVSVGVTVVATILTTWKNNSFTPEAQKADDYLQNLNERK